MAAKVDYIPYLRKMIGHSECISIGVSCLVLDENGRILLEKRTDNGLYCRPGGSLDMGETVTDGVKREVFEETGIKLSQLSLFMILSGKKAQIKYPNGDITDYVDIVFIFHVNSHDIPSIKPDSESSNVAFYDINALPPKKNMLTGTYQVIAKYLDQDFEVKVD